MSREIRFRAYHTVNRTMFFHNAIPVLLKNVADDSTWKYMQYSGLKDRAGVMIYEGDLLKPDFILGHDDTPIYVVAFVRGSFGICHVDREIIEVDWDNDARAFIEWQQKDGKIGDAFREWQYLESALSEDKYEVIGNIYEHPHLLTK